MTAHVPQRLVVNRSALVLGGTAVLLFIVFALVAFEAYNYYTIEHDAEVTAPSDTYLLHIDDVTRPGQLRDVQVAATTSTPFNTKPTQMLVTPGNSIQGLAELTTTELVLSQTLTATELFADTITMGLQTGPFLYRMPMGPRVDGDCAMTTGSSEDLVWQSPLASGSAMAYGHVSHDSGAALTFQNQSSVPVSVDPSSGPITSYSTPELTFLVPPSEPLSVVVNAEGLYWVTFAVQFQPDLTKWATINYAKLAFAFAGQTVTYDMIQSEAVNKSFVTLLGAGQTLSAIEALSLDGSALTVDTLGLVEWAIDIQSIALG
jgi:hypothetical protein